VIHVVNQIPVCWDGNGRQLKRDRIRHLILHRCSLSQFVEEANPFPIDDSLLDGPGLASRFKNRKLGTGGRVPYQIIIGRSGRVEQLLPLSIQGAHARIHNPTSIGVAVIGRTDRHEATEVQYDSLVEVCRLFLAVPGIDLAAHDALAGASGDPNKSCPGKYLPLGPLRAMALRGVCMEDPWLAIQRAGFIW